MSLIKYLVCCTCETVIFYLTWQIDAGQTVEDDHTYDQEVTEGGETVAEEKSAQDQDGEPKDVQYASIDFSALQRRAAKKQEATETEYAEIKREVKEQRENHDGTTGELMEDKEEEVTIKEEEETKDDVPEEEEGEDEAIYSKVKEKWACEQANFYLEELKWLRNSRCCLVLYSFI